MARGSIFERTNADGSVVHLVMYRDAGGRQVKRTVRGGRREAERVLAAAIAAVVRGERHASRETFGDYADRWLAEHRARIEDYTYRAYSADVRLRLKPFFGAMRLRSITPADVRRFVAALADEGKLSSKTINNAVAVLTVALGHAVEDGLIPTNPAASAGRRDRIKLPADHREMDYLRRDEIPAYLDACSTRYRPLAELLIGTGMRIGEAVALQWGDVDWRGSAIVVSRALKRSGVGSTKGKRVRRVEIGPRLLDVLRDVHATQAEHRTRDDAGALIFPSQHAGHLDRSLVSRKWHPGALKRAGLRRTVRLHDLRHSAAAAWLASGLPMMYVQRTLGHADIGTTIRNYGHLEETFLRDAAAHAEAAIFGSPV